MDLAAGGRHLRDYWHILVRRRWVVYLAVITVTLTALIGSFLITPQYRATVTLQIERQNPDILTFQDLGRMDYSWAAYNDFYQTQYRIISSKPVARRAVQQMELVSHPEFSSEASKPGLLARIKGLIPRRGARVEMEPEEIVAGRVLAGLEVSPLRNSHLVNVSWVAPQPELAAQVANAVANAYIQFNISSQFSTSEGAEGFLVNQIANLKEEIAGLEERLQDYGEAKRIVSIDDSSNITLQALSDIARRRTAAQTTLAEAEARYRAVTESPPEALPEVLRSDLIARLRQEYAAYEAEHSLQASQFKDGWPGMQTLKSKLDQAKLRLDLETDRIAGQVRATAEADYQKALKEVRNLDNLLRQQEEAAQRLRRDAVEFANLQTDVQKKRETLNALLRRQNEMALTTRLQEMDTQSTNIRIMEPARPPAAPYRPNTKANVVLGLMLGLLLGVGMAFFLDYLDNTLSSAQDLEKLIALPVLATVPSYVGEKALPRRVRKRRAEPAANGLDRVAHGEPRSATAEAYRELRTSILLSNPGQPPRRIVVTSSLPEEGKTATASNLAIVLAQLGKRVLLVDTDLRRPRLHKAFELENARGVSTYLSGLQQEVAPLVAATPIPGLDVLPSGPIPPNPSELLNSEMFTALGEKLLENGYDHIVFDSPPVLSVSDPVIIAHAMDTGILVVRAGATPRQSVKAAVGKLQAPGELPFGAVLNDLNAEQGSGYYRYQYYGRYETPEPEEQEGNSRALS